MDAFAARPSPPGTETTPPCPPATRPQPPVARQPADARQPGTRLAEHGLRAAYRLLGLQGVQPAEAGNLVALASGLAPVEGGWRPREIERLLFLRYLVERGRLDPWRCGEASSSTVDSTTTERRSERARHVPT
jgi:hypothetical protein